MNKEDLVIGAIYRDLDSPVMLESINGTMAKVWNREASYNAYCSNLREFEFYDYEAHRRSLLPKLKQGDPVVCYASQSSTCIRIFSHYASDGCIQCFLNGEYEGMTDNWLKWGPLKGFNYGEDNE